MAKLDTVKVMLTIPRDLYEEFVVSSKRSLRPLATEVLYCAREGLGARGPRSKRGVSAAGSVEGVRGVDVGKKGLPVQDLGGLKVYFKK
jgi:hypothetical protein